MRDEQKKKGNIAMAMTNEEAVSALNKTNETLVKVSNETDALLREIDRLEKALADAGGTGGTITAELEAAIKAVDTRANAIDELVADVQQPE
jgi:prefoldin subunit 5